MNQLIGVAFVALILGVIGLLWLHVGDKSHEKQSSESLQNEPDEGRVSLSSRLEISIVVAFVCGLGSMMVAFLVVFVVGATGKEWWSTLIWTVYAVAATAWTVYSFLHPKRPKWGAAR